MEVSVSKANIYDMHLKMYRNYEKKMSNQEDNGKKFLQFQYF